MSTLFGIIFLILFIGCFVGGIASSIVGKQTLATAFVIGIFVLVIFALSISQIAKVIKAKRIEKHGKKQVGKLVGAIYASRTEVNIGRKHEITYYYYPIFEIEDDYGRKTNYTSVKRVNGEDLQKLVGKEEVHFITLKSYCKIDEDLSLLPPSGTAPYLGKYMLLDENGIWRIANEIKEKKEDKKKHSPSLTLYKVVLVVLSLITIIIFGGAIFLSIYGINTNQYGLIAGAVVAIIMLFFFEIKFIKKSIIILLVNNKGTPRTAKTFTTETVYFHSSDGPTTESYLVKFSFSDENGIIQNAEEYVTDDVYFKICSRDTLPIKVYKNYASINYEII